MIYILRALMFIVVFIPCMAFGQIADAPFTDSVLKKNHIYGFPILFFTPETRWGGGMISLYNFRFKNEPNSSRPSHVELGFGYTQEKQFISQLPFRLYFNDEKYYCYGEFGYYVYSYKFYGIGNSSLKKSEETYFVDYPRIRINLLRLIKPRFYFGLRYWFEDFDIIEREKGGLLDSAGISGSDGGTTSGPGIIGIYDSRNNVFFPETGAFMKLSVQTNPGFLGSDFIFTRYSLDVSKYFKNKFEHVLALNFFGDFVYGNPPFNQMAFLGGQKKMRGYYEGRYRDRKLLLFQIEYRAPIVWRLGVVGFYSYGGVEDRLRDFQLKNFKHAVGGGIRITLDEENKMNLRIDAGFTKDGPAYYLTFGEAF